ncbi:MAG: lptG [Verrucomicrobiales bacterium]|nr:lptG [Verrucomicrobiales bacterium]
MDLSAVGAIASRFQSQWRNFRQRLEKIPWLAMVLALVGTAVWMGLTVRDLFQLSGVQQIGLQVEAVAEREQALALAYGFFNKHWLLLAKCLLPALLVALVNCRRFALVLPAALVCGWLFIWWLGGDLSRNLESALQDPLGMDSSPVSYFVKLALMGFLLMSIPLLMALYFGSTLLDQYLVRCFAVPFLLCVGGISGIMITMDLLNNANDFVTAKFGAGKILLFYLALLPQILVTITEAALLLATLYALGRMSRYNELISMMSAGRSVARIIAPVLIFAAWCALAVMALNYQLAPQADRTKDEMLQDSGRRVAKDTKRVEFNVAYRNREDRRNWLIFRLPYDLSDRNSMNEIWIMQQDAKGDPQTMIIAKRAAWNPVIRTWTFYQALVLDFTVNPEVPIKRYEEKLPIMESWRETPGSILSDRLNPEYLGVPELLAYLRTNASLPERSLAKYESAFHWRFALPFRCFLFVLLAAPLGIVSSRRGLLGGVTKAIVMFIVIYFFSAVVVKAGEGLYVSPAAGAWLINGIFLIIGLLVLWMRSSNRVLPSLNPMKWFR